MAKTKYHGKLTQAAYHKLHPLAQEIHDESMNEHSIFYNLLSGNDVKQIMTRISNYIERMIDNWTPEMEERGATEYVKTLVDEVREDARSNQLTLSSGRNMFPMRILKDFGALYGAVVIAIKWDLEQLLSEESKNAERAATAQKESEQKASEEKASEQKKARKRKSAAKKQTALDELDQLVGLREAKEMIHKAVDATKLWKIRESMGKTVRKLCLHMAFLGEPGTAKTTVARLVSRIFQECGILEKSQVLEVGRADLVGECVGQTAHKVREAFEKAKGGVLFIDEAYSLLDDHTDGYGDEAINALVQEMENHYTDTVVILAGYPKPMKKLLERNKGLRSRVAYDIMFRDYTEEELMDITIQQAKSLGYVLTEEAKERVEQLIRVAKSEENFGNGRFARSLVDHAILNHASRVGIMRKAKVTEEVVTHLTAEDFGEAPLQAEKKIRSTSALEELDQLVGLEEVKAILHQAADYAACRNLYISRGMPTMPHSMHMAFLGKPGTAKTTVARLVGRIFCECGILENGRLTEVGKAGLVGKYMGETAHKVREVFEKAKGGVLFIDEAYSLLDDHTGSYGDEALATIVQEMENHREDTLVILAGYPEPMEKLFLRNEGLRSRMGYVVSFPDYSEEEMLEIVKQQADINCRAVHGEAEEKIRGMIRRARTENGFGNGRYARQLVERALHKQASRLKDIPCEQISDDQIRYLFAEDFTEEKSLPPSESTRRIGFSG